MRFCNLVLASLVSVSCWSQTTQGLIAGRILDTRTGHPIEHIQVMVRAAATNQEHATQTDSSGYYAVAFLTPGLYRVRVTAKDYQAQEVHGVDLPVAGRVDVNFRLRRLADVWESGQYRSVFLPGSRTIVTFYG